MSFKNLDNIDNKITIACDTLNCKNIDVNSLDTNEVKINGDVVINSSKNILNIDNITCSGNINNTAGNYQINGTSVIDTTKNILNIDNITCSGNINTTTGQVEVGTGNLTTLLSSSGLRLGDGTQAARFGLSTGGFNLNILQDDGTGLLTNYYQFLNSGTGLNFPVSSTLRFNNITALTKSDLFLNDVDVNTSIISKSGNTSSFIQLECYNPIGNVPLSQLFIDCKNTGVCDISVSNALGYLSSESVRDDTTSNAPNMTIDVTTGRIQRHISALKYKENIQSLKDVLDIENVIESIDPKKYKNKITQKEHIGFIADDFHLLGITEIVEYKQKDDETKQVEGLMYPHLTAILWEYCKKLNQRLLKLEKP